MIANTYTDGILDWLKASEATRAAFDKRISRTLQRGLEHAAWHVGEGAGLRRPAGAVLGVWQRHDAVDVARGRELVVALGRVPEPLNPRAPRRRA